MIPIIQVKNISKRFIIPHEKDHSLRNRILNFYKKRSYEIFYAIKDISLTIEKGDFIGIIGKNGSGKSTLLKILAGIYKPNSGKISVKGKISPFLELGVGFNGELSGKENIYLYGAVLGFTKKQIDDKFDTIVRFAELEKFIDTKLKNYSSGMQVKLAFSIAIQADAPIFLIDEALAVGDAAFQEKCFKVFERFKKENKTIIFVSHDLESVRKLCNKVILIENGRITDQGQPAAVCNNYQNTEIMKSNENIKPKKNQDKQINLKEKSDIRITKIKLLDNKNNIKSVFNTGDVMKIRIYFSAKKNIPHPNFGVAIFHQDSHYCYGTNTDLDGIKPAAIKGEGYYQITYDPLNLLPGTYLISTGIFGYNNRKVYEFLNKRYKFKIASDKKDHGSFFIEHKWELRNEK